MRIGIVGSGHIGGTLGRRLSQLGHQVTITNSRGPQSLRDFAVDAGATAGTLKDVVDGADAVVVAIPLKAVRDLPTDGFDGLVVIDANNYYAQRDGALLEPGETSSRWVADHLKGARVVKVFNTIYSQHIADIGLPTGAANRVALPVAGDDAAAKQRVMTLVDQLGFDPVDAGGLDDSWRQEPGTAVYGTDLDADGVRKALANAQR
jgi:8-hydroxy-5-deazaflavin:NADPH oxidoreductase